MPEPIGALAPLKDSDLRRLSGLGSPEVLAPVCVVNQSRSVLRVVQAADDGLGATLAERKGAIVVVEAGFRGEALDAVQDWMGRRASDLPVQCIRVTGPPTRSRAMAGAPAPRISWPVIAEMPPGGERTL